MPIYEYQCRSCDHYLDALQKLSDSLLTDCPACGKPALRRLISAPSFRLKGSGWYETDFKSGNRRNIAEGAEPVDKGDKDDKAGKADKSEKPDKEKPKADDKKGESPKKEERKEKDKSKSKSKGKSKRKPSGDDKVA